MLKIAIYGANNRSIALLARDLKKEISISVAFDGDEKKIGKKINQGYYYIDGKKVKYSYEPTLVDNAENWNSYEFDYIVVFAGSINTKIQSKIVDNLLKYGIPATKIITYSRFIGSGIVKISELDEEAKPLEYYIKEAEKKGVSTSDYLLCAEELLEISKKLFNNNYRLFLLENIVEGIRATLNKKYLNVEERKIAYEAFSINPSLFMYEFGDIFTDLYQEELDLIENIEGSYQNGMVKIEEDDVVIDAGANFGLFSLMASAFTSSTIYAFEPISKTREILEKSAKNYSNIEVIPKALADKCGKATVDLSCYSTNQGSITMMKEECGNVSEEIDITTIDNFVEEKNLKKVDFIKADIEGAERLMLLGAKKTLKKFEPKLSICTYHYQEDSALLGFIIKSINPRYVIEYDNKKLYAYVNKEAT